MQYTFPAQYLPPTHNPNARKPAPTNPVIPYTENNTANQRQTPSFQPVDFPSGPLPPLPRRTVVPNTPRARTQAPATPPPPPATQRKPRRKHYTFTAIDLVNTVMIAAEIGFYDFEHGSKHLKEEQLGKRLRLTGLDVSDAVCKSRLDAMLKWHSDPDSCMAEVRNVMADSDYAEKAVGAPLDVLAEAFRLSVDKTDSERAILKKKADEDKAGGMAIRAASMRSGRYRASPALEPPIDDVQTGVEVSQGSNVLNAHACDDIIDISSSPMRTPTPTDYTNTPTLPLDVRSEEELAKPQVNIPDVYDEALETAIAAPAPVRAHLGLNSTRAASPSPPVKVEKENISPALRAPSQVQKLSSIDGKTRKRARKDEDDETPTRNSKRVRRHDSFDIKAHLLEERERNTEFQAQLLGKIDENTKQYAEGVAATSVFQNRFLDIIGNAFRRD